MQLGKLTLQNPVCLAAASWQLDGPDYERLGAIFTRTVTMEPKPGLYEEGIWQVADQTLLNATHMRTESAEILVQEHLPTLRRYGVPVFVSITAPGIPGFRKIARFLAREASELIAGVEVYMAQPDTGKGEELSAKFVREATQAVRNELGSEAAVIVKLPPWPEHIRVWLWGRRKAALPPWPLPTCSKPCTCPTMPRPRPWLAAFRGRRSGP
ncbi:hypothetical protein MUN84_09570 [Hymenobacter sp. 5516J-16]|uniref:hypothetical protein n=1 Tax=Hymenobacter sp. 5516J-16 TaxID=2932253 RepID=UPI001FD0B9AA|nr:hypothetical protein [Hymenobacter sp. 5516J-16]UOQ78752.1 hypothetical protein MUN84_09570 [Hymenobacter sp. 5516J-16]